MIPQGILVFLVFQDKDETPGGLISVLQRIKISKKGGIN